MTDNEKEEKTVNIPLTERQIEMLSSGLGSDLDEDTYIGYFQDRQYNNDENKQKTRDLQNYIESFLKEFHK